MSQGPGSQEYHRKQKISHVIKDSDDEQDLPSTGQKETGTSSSQKQTQPHSSGSTDKNTKQEPANKAKNHTTPKDLEEDKNASVAEKKGEKQNHYVNSQESEESDGESEFSKSESESEEQSEEEESSEEQSETVSKASALKPRKIKEESKHEPPLSKKTQQKKQTLPSIQRTSQRKEGVLNNKEDIIQELMVRWWYVLPDWPPEDLDYGELLKEKGCRAVPAEIFHFQNQTDENGLHKVVALSNYVGIYRRSDGSLLDLRPKETMPCYANFFEKSKDELIDLLQRALQNQIRALKNTASYLSRGQDVKLMKQVCRLYLTVKKLKV